MRFDKVCLAAVFLAFSLAASGQTKATPSMGSGGGITPAMEVSLGYSYFHSNAPPGGCGCFSLNGGYGAFIYHLTRNWGAVADLSAAHANNVSGTTQNITTFDYLFGPRYTLASFKRITPYGQVLLGGVKESSNYAYVQNTNAFGLSAGGGINATINRIIGWNIVEIDWNYSRLPNGVNTHQNLFHVSTGINLRFGVR